ncbi:SIS domain-containing protein [Caulobacter sp. 17J80-11]|uniref:SIS domain-containing protein n=1 Tax=Caulobacter sp. 17J80-11 TaxID=2763502 RepID=UPI002105CB6E|nr:SIS domain-containing protein [Caulobacter sp. 17J80-11]
MNAMAPTLKPEATRMFAEAAEASRVVAGQLADGAAARLGARLRELQPRVVVTCARGSSDHAATYAKYLIETRTGVPTASAAPSIASVYAAEPKLDGALFLAISQSGKSPDLLAGAEQAKKAGAFVAALVNVEDSPLAELADAVVPLKAGPELSVAATKSYIASLSAIAGVVAAWAGDEALEHALTGLPDALARAWALDWSPAVGRLVDARDLYVVGRGLGFGVAQEAALKFKETCGLHAEAFSAAEVKHGPMALVQPGFPVLALAQDDETREGVAALAAEFAARGAEVIAAGVEAPGALVLPTVAGHPALEPLLRVQSFYRMANALSVARGFDPDRPPHLAKVTETF